MDVGGAALRSTGVLARAACELQRTGLIFAVDRSTGAIRELTVREFSECERVHLLDGYVVCLGRAIAEATASAIRRSGLETN